MASGTAATAPSDYCWFGLRLNAGSAQFVGQGSYGAFLMDIKSAASAQPAVMPLGDPERGTYMLHYYHFAPCHDIGTTSCPDFLSTHAYSLGAGHYTSRCPVFLSRRDRAALPVAEHYGDPQRFFDKAILTIQLEESAALAEADARKRAGGGRPLSPALQTVSAAVVAATVVSTSDKDAAIDAALQKRVDALRRC